MTDQRTIVFESLGSLKASVHLVKEEGRRAKVIPLGIVSAQMWIPSREAGGEVLVREELGSIMSKMSQLETAGTWTKSNAS